MCRMSFFASTVSAIVPQIESRAASLKVLHTRGFRSAHNANLFLRLEREVGYLSTPLVEQPHTNLYYVNSSSDDIDTVVAELVAEADKIRTNCDQVPECADPTCTVQNYFEGLRVAADRSAAAARAAEAAANVAVLSAQYKAEMASLLAEAEKNLVGEDSVQESTAESSSSLPPPSAASSSNATTASSTGFFSTLSSVFGLSSNSE